MLADLISLFTAAADMAGAADILALASENPVLAMGAGVAAIGTAVAATFAMANKATTQPTTALQAYEAATTDVSDCSGSEVIVLLAMGVWG